MRSIDRWDNGRSLRVDPDEVKRPKRLPEHKLGDNLHLRLGYEEPPDFRT
jgi:hypothetical protein